MLSNSLYQQIAKDSLNFDLPCWKYHGGMRTAGHKSRYTTSTKTSSGVLINQSEGKIISEFAVIPPKENIYWYKWSHDGILYDVAFYCTGRPTYVVVIREQS